VVLLGPGISSVRVAAGFGELRKLGNLDGVDLGVGGEEEGGCVQMLELAFFS